MPRLENFSASVIVDGNPLEEYGIEISTDGKKATSWITSEAGKVERVYQCLIAWCLT
jgi:hypothetical protein